MECLHGKATSYNLLEGNMRMQSHIKWKDFVWIPVMVVKSVILVKGNINENERWQMYGLQAIERVNGERMVWNEFAEAMRVLKLAVDRDLLEHLQQLEKDPDYTFVDSLMELHENTENHELQ